MVEPAQSNARPANARPANAGPSGGLIIAAPHSGSGKTLVTLGLLRAFSNRGMALSSAKAGPDYIDPQFHSKASGGPCVNLDPWAMRPDYLKALVAAQSGNVLIEGMMGLFDGAADGSGSVADLAALLNLPVLLVVDVARQSHSVAALVQGFANHRKDVFIAGVILNRVGSARHEKMLRKALSAIAMPVLGAIYRQPVLHMPERHLGLVQADEYAGLEAFIDNTADIVEKSVDIDAVNSFFATIGTRNTGSIFLLRPPGQTIAIARDEAFAFAYPHLLDGWKKQGAELRFFSPLANEAPAGDTDAIYLPGGYPELHGARLAACNIFFKGLKSHVEKGHFVYGECGGYMVLGNGIVDRDGNCHKMAGLLPLDTSFEKPVLHLGYRRITVLQDSPLAASGTKMSAHEFHYASVVGTEGGEPLFSIRDALGENEQKAGLCRGNVMGSFMHLIDLEG